MPLRQLGTRCLSSGIRGAKGLPAKLEENRERRPCPINWHHQDRRRTGRGDRQAVSWRAAARSADCPVPRAEFKNWLDDLLREAKEAGENGEAETPIQAEVDYDVVLDQAGFDAWLKKLRRPSWIAFRYRVTTSIDAQQAQVVGCPSP